MRRFIEKTWLFGFPMSCHGNDNSHLVMDRVTQNSGLGRSAGPTVRNDNPLKKSSKLVNYESKALIGPDSKKDICYISLITVSVF